MKAHLMFSDRDLDLGAKPCFNSETLGADLELQRILSAMARKDETIGAVCTAALFQPLLSIEEIHYRQEALRDALQNPETVRRLYGITVQTFEEKQKSWHWLSNRYLSSTFSDAVALLKIYVAMLMKLRKVADAEIHAFKSEGLVNLLTMLQQELSDDYFSEVHTHLEELEERDGFLISAELGNYNQGIHYVLRRKERRHFRFRWAFAPSFSLAPRDDAGATDLGNRRDRAINEAANALAQAAEHIEGFFAMLQKELAFYVGCLNLCDTLKKLGMPVCIPSLPPQEQRSRSWKGLYDVSLALTKNEPVVGNELSMENKRLTIVTGANQGGKSTFLRSIGQAQLMAQCGMPVGAGSFSAPLRAGVFTHFKKEEDSAMKSGKLDEELVRMDELADHLQPDSLILFNESFAATNEREGSEICRQITQALIDHRMEVFSVTHLYTYASGFLKDPGTQFLRAQRLKNGNRTFKVVPGAPLKTAFGEDLYQKIFTEKEE